MSSNLFNGLFEQTELCPLCNISSEKTIQLYTVKHLDWIFNILQCTNCGLTYKSHFPTAQYFTKIYSESYSHYAIENINSDIEAQQHRLTRIGKPHGKLLDYGCGNGSFVLAALNKGWDAFGCDPFLPNLLTNEILNKRCYKANILKESFSEMGLYNCITMWATAEHIVDSKNTFKNLFSLLEKDGLFVFNSPFGNSKIARKYGAKWRMANIIEHLQFHTFKSVEYLSSIENMTIESIRVCGNPYPLGKIDLVTNFNKLSTNNHNKIDNNLKKSILKDVSDFVLNEIISKNKFGSKDIFLYIINLFKIGDHLEVILRKK